MKTSIVFSALSAALLFAGSGCSKKEDAISAPPAAESAPTVADKVIATAQGQTEVVKKAVQDAAANVQSQAAAANDKAQGMIDQAKQLVSENKFSEAMAALNGLANQQLTPEQQSLVAKLKEQIQKAMQGATTVKDEAAKAVGGLLQPK